MTVLRLTMQTKAPVCVFAFNRPRHLKLTLSALAANNIAKNTDLFIFCDGPRHDKDIPLVKSVHDISDSVTGFKSVKVAKQQRNIGLSASITSGVTEIIKQYERVVVVEDDLVVSKFFLQYMNDGLHTYSDNTQVASIHGWCFKHNVQNAPETFFLRGADCWGWATWKRSWEKYNHDAGELLIELNRRCLTCEFDIGGVYGYTEMLKDAIEGKIDSWAIRWHASAFLADMYTLYPGKSLVKNIGLDASGRHCGKIKRFSPNICNSEVVVKRQEVIEDATMRVAQRKAFNDLARRCISRAKWKNVLKKWMIPTGFLKIMHRVKSKFGKSAALR